MSRPRTPLGTFGEITTTALKSGQTGAKTRFGDPADGKARLTRATANSKAAATRELKKKIARRLETDSGGSLRGDEPFAKLAELWIEQMKASDLSARSKSNYDYAMGHYLLPRLQDFTVREVTVARCDKVLRDLGARHGPSRAKLKRTVLMQTLGLAVRCEIIPRNPVAGCTRIKQRAPQPDAFGPEEARLIRRLVREWRQGEGIVGPPPDGQVAAAIDVTLWTSARIGEVLALRRCDVDMAADPPTAHFHGTVVYTKETGIFRSSRPKTHRSNRKVVLPSFAAVALEERLAKVPDEAEALVIQSRHGKPVANTMYVVCVPDGEAHQHDGRTPDVRSVLANILANSGAEHSAHQAAQTEQEAWDSWRQLEDECTAIRQAAEQDLAVHLIENAYLPARLTEAILASPLLGSLIAELRRAAEHGARSRLLLRTFAASGQTDPKSDPAVQLATRLRAATDAHIREGARPRPGTGPSPLGDLPLELHEALEERRRLIQQMPVDEPTARPEPPSARII